MNKKLFSILVFLLTINISYSQSGDNEYSEEDEITDFEGIKDNDKDKIDLSKLRIGGDIGFGLGNGQLFAEFSPTIGYQIIEDRLEIGPGLVYQHLSEVNQYALNNIGGQAYIRAYVFDGFYAQIDGLLVNSNVNYLKSNSVSSFTYGNGFIGAGYALNHKDSEIYLTVSVKTNIMIDKYYPYRQIIPKVGFQFKL